MSAFIATNSIRQRSHAMMLPSPAFACDLVTHNDHAADVVSIQAPILLAEALQPQQQFEAVAPPTQTLVGMAVIVVLCAITAWYWQTQVVPVSRTNLAMSKKKGPLRDYLQELEDAGDRQGDEMVAVVNGTAAMQSSETNDGEPSRAFERWLFTDWLQSDKPSKPGRQKEPALPILKDAKWNSGDNPVLAATALISLGVLITSITERVSGALF